MTTFLSRLEVMVRSIPLRISQAIRRRHLMDLYLVAEFPRAMKFEDIVEPEEVKDEEKDSVVKALDRIADKCAPKDSWEVTVNKAMRVPRGKPTFGGWFYADEKQAVAKAKERAEMLPTMKLVVMKMTSRFELGTVTEVKAGDA